MKPPSRAEVSRRGLLAGSAGLVTVAGLGACADQGPGPLPRAPQVDAGATGIDVHSHVFNARDLPIAGFVTEVVLEGQPLGQLAVGPLATLLSLVMDLSAWPPDREIRGLTDGSVTPFVAAAVTPESTTERIRALTTQAVQQMQQRSDRYGYVRNRVAAHLQQAGQQQHLLAMASPEASDAGLLRTLASRAGALPQAVEGRAAALQEIAPQAAANGAVAVQDEVYRVFLLASLVTERRTDLVRRLSRLPAAAADADSIAMYNPALVDYSYWLGEPTSPLDQQVAVMSAIAAIKGRPYLVHPWVSFCPWRQLAEPGQFTLVQDAIRTKGFIGVKLYPVMGFRPIGNDGAPDAASYPEGLRDMPEWGRRMDSALSDLYDWCVAEDVPIMAHCSFSQYPSPAAGKRGSPQAWRPVLQQPKWRNLRLNVAHLGGIWNLAKDPNGWAVDAVKLLAEFPNVYGDVADYDAIVAATADQQAMNAKVLPRLRSLLDTSPAARAKVMYGTDWLLLSRAAGVDGYYAAMRDKMPVGLGIDRDGFLGLNAARFLGLDQPRRERNTRQRLEDFLLSRGIPITVLDRWARPGVRLSGSS